MYPEAYIQFLVQFHAHRDYFECHEILEEYWKETDPANRFSPWVGLIQIAVGLYHHRRENFRGAEKILTSAYSILRENTSRLQRLSLDSDILLRQVNDCLTAVKNHKAFEDMNLPLSDPCLISHCKQESARQQAVWLRPSDLSDKQLIHRHILRHHHSGSEEERLKQKRNL